MALNLWLKYPLIITYADDRSTSNKAKTLALLAKMLEEEAVQVLKFMASNGLVTNATKTALLLLNMQFKSLIQYFNLNKSFVDLVRDDLGVW